jgi:hypothetical protein
MVVVVAVDHDKLLDYPTRPQGGMQPNNASRQCFVVGTREGKEKRVEGESKRIWSGL